jgi:MYXO-CTERM domain-containing protein
MLMQPLFPSWTTAAAVVVLGAWMPSSGRAAHTEVLPTRALAFVQASVGESTGQLQVVNGVLDPIYTYIQGPVASFSSNTLVPGATTVDARAGASGAFAPPVIGMVSSAQAYASLDQGTLRSAVVQAGPASFGYPLGQASSQLRDTLLFTNNSGAAVTLSFSYDFEGLIADPHGSSNRGGEARLYLTNCALCSNAAGEPIRFATGPQNPASLLLAATFDIRGIGSFTNFGTPLPLGPSANVTVLRGPADGNGGAVEGRIAVSLLIPTGLTSLGIGADLDVDCRSGSSCLFGNSASFSFGALPTGLAMSSASGVFLTAPVPEPQTWLMWAAGLLALASLRRRHAG